MKKTEVHSWSRALETPSTSDANQPCGSGMFGKRLKEGDAHTMTPVEKSKESKTVPVVDLAESSEEEKEESHGAPGEEEKASSLEEKVNNILKSLSNATREKQDEILKKMRILRVVKKEQNKETNRLHESPSDSDIGLYSDGDSPSEDEEGAKDHFAKVTD